MILFLIRNICYIILIIKKIYLIFRSKLLEEWKSFFGKTRGSSLILFLGAGGVVLYLIRRRRRRRHSAPSPREANSVSAGVGARTFLKRRGRHQRSRGAAGSQNSLWSWLFEEELVEDLSRKRYSKIDQHLARHFKNNVECLSCPPPFLCIQIITPFSHLMISTNQKTGL